MDNQIIILLLAFTIIREVLFQYSMQKLVNKVMSRNFVEYQHAEATTTVKRPTITVSQDEPEDLRTLQGFTM